MNRGERRRQRGRAKRSLAGARTGAALAEALAAATRHHQAGRFADAEALYRRVLRARPDHPETLHYLGVLYHQQGRHEQAIAFLEKAVGAAPDDAPCLYNLGEAYRAAGRYADAVESYRRALALAPDMADIHFGLANALLELGETEAAVAAYERALALSPDDAEAHLNLGNALTRCGREDEALDHYRRAAALDPGYAEAHVNLGAALAERGEAEEAVECHRRALALRPDLAEAHFNLGVALAACGRPEEAVAAFGEGLARGADPFESHVRLGRAWERLGDMEQALAHYAEALALRPDDAETLCRAGYAALVGGDAEEGAERVARALRLDPRSAEAHYAMGFYHEQRGRFDEAVACYRRALDIEPGHTTALHALATVENAGDRGTQAAAIARHLERADLAETDRATLEFALARLYDAEGRVDDAFALYERANRRKGASVSFDPAAFRRGVDEVIATLDAAFFAERASFGGDSERPVFVVGMPRSCTTLVEQILASHPRVFGAGERNDMRRLIAALPERLGVEETYPRTLLRLDRDLSRRLADEHDAALAQLAPGAARVVDKMPNNFLRLGFIALLFPRARVIHCRRDPVDTCLSCFFQNFLMGQEFSYDLTHLGLYYREYERLMDHWRAVLSVPLLEVQYEDLVADQEGVSRRMIEFLGLEWDDRCLRFYEGERTVRTASLWQVRQPLYRSSVGRWRLYERHLGPLLRALGGADETSPGEA